MGHVSRERVFTRTISPNSSWSPDGHNPMFDMDLEADDSEEEDIRYSYAARWNFSSRPFEPTPKASRTTPTWSQERQGRTSLGIGRRGVPNQNAWLPLLPLPQEVREERVYGGTGQAGPRGLIGKHAEPPDVYRVRARDHRVVGHFLDQHLPEFDPGVSFPVLLNSADCYAWAIQPSRPGSGWTAQPGTRSILEDLWNDTPPSTPPYENVPLGRRFGPNTGNRMDESLDHRLPILGCLIVRIMPVRKPECDFDSTRDVGRGKPRAILHFMALAVDPEYRRLGIAETLVGTAIGKAGEVAASKGGWGLPFNTTTISPPTTSLSSSQSTISSSASSASHSPTGYFDNMYNHHHHHRHHDKQSQSQHHQSHDTISITIALRAEGIIRRSRTTGEKDEGSMLFWQRMGLTTRVVRLRGRKGWEGDSVRDVQVPIYRL